ncbi:hypothetical protein ACLKA6_008401 [Drosophila palustris]
MNNAQTGILLNERFTQMQYREQLTPTPTLTPTLTATPNPTRGRRSRSRSRSRRIVEAAAGGGNKRLLQELERKYFTQTAGNAAGLRVGGIKPLRIGPGGKLVRSNRSDRGATMRADLIANGECGRRSNSGTRQSSAAVSVAGLRQRLGASRPSTGGSPVSRSRDQSIGRQRSCGFFQSRRRDQSRVQSHSRTRDQSNGCGQSRGFQESNRLDQSRGRNRSRGRDKGREFEQSNGRDQSRGRNQSRGRDQSIKSRPEPLNPFQTRGRWQQSASAGKGGGGGGAGGRVADRVSVKQRLGVRRGVARGADKRGGLRSQVGGFAVEYTDKRPDSDTARVGIATGTGWWGHKGRARGISATDSRSRSRSWRRRRDRSSQHRSWKCIPTKSWSRSKTNNF